MAHVPQELRDEDDEREIVGVAVILDGSFNPGIIHPYWFVANGMMSREEAESATGVRVGADFGEFLVPDFAFRCRRDRLRVASPVRSENFERIFRIVLRTLEVLPHMPVRTLSLNRS